MSLSEIISTAMNNPECSIFTGMFVGQLMMLRYMVYFIVLVWMAKFLDRIVLRPLALRIKRRLWKGKQ
jgi:hypothetical protein